MAEEKKIIEFHFQIAIHQIETGDGFRFFFREKQQTKNCAHAQEKSFFVISDFEIKIMYILCKTCNHY